ncbi:hydroxymethylglutaryl-CoA lyase [Aeromicrobium tamlense]|uniref:Hydroxymethylglutaryl-CoA lyase n=1 Tax=Aeromicrobium tamlense TaxID=375541 RepID=A0A8I0FY66_9ACTN|nr:hydroxymethylglutaryl-CoA lyase [Aeromicrobium tamlense]MBD1270753.1 hydroxymethylglutaryl-CoA lyase [Aeromicrobium tamlense]MBD1271115.1 hydroxymethylglutaryl-CoA lyase [Aeromicrobium tamlense]NYI38145.1 hydroxymethylglutaryl-CoA lyase [Aeromicrobium tamlense]
MVDVFPLPLPATVEVVEVVLRDGLQTVPEVMPLRDKLRVVELMLEAGVRRIEVTSFAHPRVLPQFADAERLLAALPRDPSVTYRGLVPNLRGAQRAVDAGVDELVFLVSTSDEANRGNQGRGTDELLNELAAAVDLSRSGAKVTAGVAAAFFSVPGGRVLPSTIDGLVDGVVAAGAQSLYLADSLGMADPLQVYEATRRVKRRHPSVDVGLHLHVRNGFVMANVFAGLLAGASWFESAAGGLGGDAWFPGHPDVLGNLPTEDLLAFMSRLRVESGVSPSAYAAVTVAVADATGRASLDHVSRGGAEHELAALTWESMLAGFPGLTTARPRS